jgi:circadian clock protein KaiB
VAPLPLRRFIGDLSDDERLRRSLDPLHVLHTPGAGE